MIELYEIKKNNDYDYYFIADLPVSGSRTIGETFLSDVNDLTENVTRGYSYEWTGSAWKRIEAKQDANTDIFGTLSNVCNALNNYFFAKDSLSCDFYNCKYDPKRFCDISLMPQAIYIYGDGIVYLNKTATTSETIPFQVGDLVYNAKSERNSDKFGYVDDITGDVITFNRSFTSETSYGLMVLSVIPEQVQQIINKMIWFDAYKRDLLSNGSVQSESTGSYSVSFKLDGLKVGDLVYPSSLTNGLKGYQYARIM